MDMYVDNDPSTQRFFPFSTKQYPLIPFRAKDKQYIANNRLDKISRLVFVAAERLVKIPTLLRSPSVGPARQLSLCNGGLAWASGR